jgi:hypothetical protein
MLEPQYFSFLDLLLLMMMVELVSMLLVKIDV